MLIRQHLPRLIFTFIILVFTALTLYAQDEGVFTLTADMLKDGNAVELNNLKWRYHAGDDAAWAQPDFDDGEWEKLRDTNLDISNLPRGGWNGRAWFRLRVQVDERLVNQPLALRMWHFGASEVYVDGELRQSFGRIEPEGDDEFNPRGLPAHFVFARGGTHTIAVRYSFKATSDLTQGRGRWLTRSRFTPGFSSRLTTAQDAALRLERRAREERDDYVFMGLLAALALVHFLLFVFYRGERGNLFYSFFAIGLAATLWLARLTNTGHFGATAALLSDFARNEVQGLAVMSLLAFLYVEFAGRLSRFFWVLLSLWIAGIVLHAAQVSLTAPSTPIMLVVTLADCLRIMVRSLIERRAGAWIIAAGIGVLFVGVAINIAVGNNFVAIPTWLHQLNINLTVLSVPLAVSVYLARKFARTNKRLEAELEHVKELSEKQIEHERIKAENERRAKELEEARQLQLSMLPKSVPQLPNLEIAAYMKPATEVGGDYYDFHVGDDGTLTVAVGDATGHGLKAGSVVTATKSLFNAFAQEANIPHIFQQSSRALKKMNLRGLYMAMTMAKIKDSRMAVSAAGMPPILVYRAATKQVVEVAIKAMPLGSVSNFPYQQEEFPLSAGDTIVLMSDGFAERFNEQGEILDYQRATEVLIEVAHQSPQEIISHFVQVGEQWANGRPQDDDITFVVLKVKNDNNFATGLGGKS